MAPPIRVLIADDHPAVRRGLVGLLSLYSDIQVVGEVADSPSVLRTAAHLAPDVILLDIQMPGADGVDVSHQLTDVAPNSKVIILTAFDRDDYVIGALKNGAYAYLLKSISDEIVVETIRQVSQGKRLLSPELLDKVLQQFESMARTQTRLDSDLSEMDIILLQSIAQGATSEEIATQMSWSERSIKRNIEDILTKLGVKNRTQAVVEAIKRGLI